MTYVKTVQTLAVTSIKDIYNIYVKQKKSLKIPNGQSETIYQRRTDNTMANIKSTRLCTNLNIHCNISIGGFSDDFVF